MLTEAASGIPERSYWLSGFFFFCIHYTSFKKTQKEVTVAFFQYSSVHNEIRIDVSFENNVFLFADGKFSKSPN